MGSTERPCLRGFEVQNFVHKGEPQLQIANRERLSDQCLRLPQAMGLILQYFDGDHTIEEILREVQADAGVKVARSMVEQIIQELDSVCVLDTPTYAAAQAAALADYRRSGVREPAHAGGAYYAEPDRLREQVRRIFEHPQGAGRPDFAANGKSEKRLRAVLAPHIDFHRGGPSFGWAFRELAERTDADLFVIVATSHYSPERFTLTRNDFQTPLGIARTDKKYVDALAARYGEEAAYADELAHRPEHSIEFEVVLLQYIFGGVRDFSIVPLLVGPFHDAVESGAAPIAQDDVARMVGILREVEQQSGRSVCYVVSGDLAHIGPKFGDPWKIDSAKAEWNRGSDAQLLARMETGRAEDLFASIVAEQDERRICGFPPTYTMLEAARPSSGKVLFHDQYVDPAGKEIVSFASMAFYS